MYSLRQWARTRRVHPPLSRGHWQSAPSLRLRRPDARPASSQHPARVPGLRPSTRRSSCDTQWPTASKVRASRAATRAQQRDSSAFLQYWGLVALGFLLCSRPTAVCLLDRDDIDVQLHAITLQKRTFKGSETGAVPRVAIRIPIPVVPGPAHDPVYRLVTRLVSFGYLPGGDTAVPASDRRLAARRNAAAVHL
jgi:hypothetical protein